MKVSNMRMRIVMAVAISAVFVLFSSYTWYPGVDADRPQGLLKSMMQVMNYYHYQPQDLNDQFSEHVFDQYIERLDYYKRFLTQEDLDKLKAYREGIDDEIESGSEEMFLLSVELFDKRVDQTEGFFQEILAQPFDFTKQENYENDPKQESFAANSEELKAKWRQSLKFQTLSRLSDMLDRQEKALEAKEEGYEVKTFEAMEVEARAKVLKNQEDWFARIRKTTLDDREAEYINAVLSIYDPHTGYFPPKDKSDFDIEISGKLEGIGARLSPEDGNIKVVYIVPGSPSFKQGELEVNDIITKVAQGEDGEPVDVTGMELDDAIQLIRGKKGTLVNLTVKKLDGSVIVVPIVRDVIEIEESFAKSAIVKREEDGLRIGYIDLPSFYFDFNDRNGRRCASDIKKEVQKLKAENVDGIVIDLRDNLGGSLNDVVEMSGYFIEQGPIVQVRSKQGRPQVLSDNDPSVLYDGPLVIMINSFSASASEIMAAALQDYDRAIVVGTTSYGKGTVQRFLALDDLLRTGAEADPVGDVKLTIQKFYRINGGATQQRGVVPDIILPDQYMKLDVGEREQAFSMPWDEISPATHRDWTDMPDRDKLRKASEARRKNSLQWEMIETNATRMRERQDQDIYPMEIEAYRAQEQSLREQSKEFRDLFKPIDGIEVVSPLADAEFINTDSVRIARYDRWHADLSKDVYVNEVINILGDMQKK
ncbi:MAG: carboxy terminal-processing peptidase [Bacteroidia bacterium]|nr:carboxy terminal-processing peptidase [Bacteroidia bacterium]